MILVFFTLQNADFTKLHNGKPEIHVMRLDIGANVSNMIYYDVLLSNKPFRCNFEFEIRC